MGWLDFIFGSPQTPEQKAKKKLKNLETRRAESQLRLAREKSKFSSDPLRVDRYTREIVALEKQIEMLKKQFPNL